MHLENSVTTYNLNRLESGIIADYISSSASTVELSLPIQTCQNPHPLPGDLVVVCVQEVNPAYPMLELPDGSELSITKGTLLVGALGSRKALHGFSGRVPSELQVGQQLSLLNKGGVIGECTAFHRDLEWPTQVEYLGTVFQGDSKVNLADSALPLIEGPLPKTPLILVLGTCMNSGKTTVCTRVIETFASRGLHINSGKVAGVACKQDLLAMGRSGAKQVLSFHDFGLASSSDVDSLVPVTRSLIHHLATPETDFIVLEMGDGILGGYHVSTLFSDKELFDRQVCRVVCANDLMGVWGALQWMDQHIEKDLNGPVLISGPVTDSGQGVDYIESNWSVPAANPFDSPGKLCSFVQKSLQSC
jgi:hypothetical protein